MCVSRAPSPLHSSLAALFPTVTFIILVKLGVETPETLHKQVLDGDLNLFMVLARAFEASESHEAPAGTIYLASGKTLSR